ncbi:MAG: type II toxin-antitoxin system PemK/MazF family toxin [Methanobacterium sp.]
MVWNRGEIWCVNLTPSIGNEMEDPHPAVIVNDDRIRSLDFRIIVPITTYQAHFKGQSFFVKINSNNTNGLDHASAANVLQVRSVDARKRFMHQIGRVTKNQMDKIEEALCIVMQLPFNP